MMRQELLRELRLHGLSDAELTVHAERVAAGSEDPYAVVPRLVQRAFRGESGVTKEKHGKD